jgi:DNA (cytosine-5)-methyltransferase 1
MARKSVGLAAAADAVGVASITLKRWLLSGKVTEVARDRNGWRVFTPQDIARIRRYARTLHHPGGK